MEPQATPPVESSQSVVPVQLKISSKLPWIILVIVLLLAFGTGGVFLGRQLSANPSIQISPTPSPVSEIPTPTLDPTRDWPVHTLNGAYTFKYPFIAKIENANQYDRVVYWGRTQKEGTDISDGIYLQFGMIKTSNLEKYLSSKIAAEAPKGKLIAPLTPVTINGYAGFTYTHEGLGGNPKYIYLSMPNSGSAIEITDFTVDPGNFGFATTVNQILSTFRFINQSSALTATPTTAIVWKSYSSSSAGFTLQYPSTARTATRDPDPFPVAVEIQNLSPRTSGGGGPEVEGWIMIFSETQDNSRFESLRQWALEKNLITNQTIQDTKIGSKDAITWKTSGGDANLTNYLVYRGQGDKITYIVINNDGTKGDSDIVQILSSITFTN